MRYVITLVVIAGCGRPSSTSTRSTAKRDAAAPTVARCVAPDFSPLGRASADSSLVGELAAVAPSIDALAPPQPVFRFRRPATATTAHVDVCRDRGCTKLLAKLEATGSSAQAPAPLEAGHVFWRVVTAAGKTRARPLRVRSAGSAHGGSIVRALDWNGDGYADHVRVTRDAIEVWPGGPHGLQPEPIRVVPPGAVASIAPGGDVDGDGSDDLVIGVPDALSTGSPKEVFHTGAAFVLWGGPQGRAPKAIHVADAGRLGSSVTTADLDDDSWNDVIIAAEGISLPASATVVSIPSIPRVFGLRGGPGGLAEPTELTRGAEAVQGAGVLEGDGITRVAVRLHPPGVECLAATPGTNAIDVSVHGGGNAMLVVPDLDGDGSDDLLYGDLIVHDASSGMHVWRTLPHAIARVAGDFDGDGNFELAALALGGGLDMFDRTSLANGVAPAQHLDGVAAESLDAGDFDGDGFDDLVLDSAGAKPFVLAGSARGLRR